MSRAPAVAEQSRILVVDDEMGPRESLRMLLKPAYQIKTADSGRAALEEIPKFHPDLVILDIKMAEMDGLEALRRVKALDNSIEVVMITAYASLDTVKQALTHGAFEYLIKPFSRQDLEDVVRRALLRRHTDLGRQSQLSRLVEEMRGLSAKTRALEESARREAAEQSLRVTQLSIMREISRTIVRQLDVSHATPTITEQLRVALDYDSVSIVTDSNALAQGQDAARIICPIKDAEGVLAHLVVDNRRSGRPIDPRDHELLEMLAEYLAIALRNSRLYGQIEETKQSLEQVIESAGEAIISVSMADQITGWNPAAERIFGVSAPEAIGRAITDVLMPSDFERAKAKLTEGASAHAFESSALVGKTAASSLAVTLSALRGRQGQLEGMIAIVRDVTLQREIENQLHQSEKLTALGQLAGGIAHDFNNLLQAILGYAQLMKINPENTDLITRSLQVVESAALDGSETVRRIQTFARLRPDEPFIRVDPNQIVQDAIAITKPRWEERIAQDNRPLEMKLKLASTLPAIRGRPAALTETLTNLVLNAMDAMPRGGTLTISTKSKNGSVVLSVTDTGVGMTDAVRRRIFEPFFSTKGEKGSGLGLAMAYSIVKRHGGEIRVDSEPERGTTFTLTFPAVTNVVEETSTVKVVKSRRTARVLVVDDQPHVLGSLAELLQTSGYAVTTAATGAGAMADYKPGRYDVVVSNVGMPGVNGWQLAERIRSIDRDVGIVFVTGWGLRDEDQVRLEALGIHRCLFKPVKPDDLDAAVQAALDPL